MKNKNSLPCLQLQNQDFFELQEKRIVFQSETPTFINSSDQIGENIDEALLQESLKILKNTGDLGNKKYQEPANVFALRSILSNLGYNPGGSNAVATYADIKSAVTQLQADIQSKVGNDFVVDGLFGNGTKRELINILQAKRSLKISTTSTRLKSLKYQIEKKENQYKPLQTQEEKDNLETILNTEEIGGFKTFLSSLILTKPDIFAIKDANNPESKININEAYSNIFVEVESNNRIPPGMWSQVLDDPDEPQYNPEKAVKMEYENIFNALAQLYKKNPLALKVVQAMNILGGKNIDLSQDKRLNDPITQKDRTGLFGTKFLSSFPALFEDLGILPRKYIPAQPGGRFEINTTTYSDKPGLDILVDYMANGSTPEQLEQEINTYAKRNENILKSIGSQKIDHKKIRSEAIRDFFLGLRYKNNESNIVQQVSGKKRDSSLSVDAMLYLMRGEKERKTGITGVFTDSVEWKNGELYVNGKPGTFDISGKIELPEGSICTTNPSHWTCGQIHAAAAAQEFTADKYPGLTIAEGVVDGNTSFKNEDGSTTEFIIVHTGLGQKNTKIRITNSANPGEVTLVTLEENGKINYTVYEITTKKKRPPKPKDRVVIKKTATVSLGKGFEESASLAAEWIGSKNNAGLGYRIQSQFYSDLLRFAVSTSTNTSGDNLVTPELSGKLFGKQWSAELNTDGDIQSFSAEIFHAMIQEDIALSLNTTFDKNGEIGAFGSKLEKQQSLQEVAELITNAIESVSKNNAFRNGLEKELSTMTEGQKEKYIIDAAKIFVFNNINDPKVVPGLERWTAGLSIGARKVWNELVPTIGLSLGHTSYTPEYVGLADATTSPEKTFGEMEIIRNPEDGSIDIENIINQALRKPKYNGYSYAGEILNTSETTTDTNEKNPPITIKNGRIILADGYNITNLNFHANTLWRTLKLEITYGKNGGPTQEHIGEIMVSPEANVQNPEQMNDFLIHIHQTGIIEKVLRTNTFSQKIKTAIQHGDLNTQWELTYKSITQLKLTESEKEYFTQLNDLNIPAANKLALIGLAGWQEMDARHVFKNDPSALQAEKNNRLNLEERNQTVSKGAQKYLGVPLSNSQAAIEELSSQGQDIHTLEINTVLQCVIQTPNNSVEVITLVPGQKIEIIGEVVIADDGSIHFQNKECNGNYAVAKPVMNSVPLIRETMAAKVQEKGSGIGVMARRNNFYGNVSVALLSSPGYKKEYVPVISEETNTTSTKVIYEVTAPDGTQFQIIQGGKGTLTALRIPKIEEFKMIFPDGKIPNKILSDMYETLSLAAIQDVERAAQLVNAPIDEVKANPSGFATIALEQAISEGNDEYLQRSALYQASINLHKKYPEHDMITTDASRPFYTVAEVIEKYNKMKASVENKNNNLVFEELTNSKTLEGLQAQLTVLKSKGWTVTPTSTDTESINTSETFTNTPQNWQLLETNGVNTEGIVVDSNKFEKLRAQFVELGGKIPKDTSNRESLEIMTLPENQSTFEEALKKTKENHPSDEANPLDIHDVLGAD